MVVEWPFQENGVDRIYTALVKVGFCHLNESHLLVKLRGEQQDKDGIDALQCTFFVMFSPVISRSQRFCYLFVSGHYIYIEAFHKTAF